MASSSPFGLHSGYSNALLRQWQSSGTELHAHNFMLPLFIVDDEDAQQEVGSLPGVSRWGVNSVISYLRPVVETGLTSVLLFGVPANLPKDDVGSAGESEANPVMAAIKKIKAEFPELTIACDVCLCPYTSHGHCGVLREDGTINNEASIEKIAQQAVAFARAGADIVAPSDMMDSRVLAIKEALRKNDLGSKVSVLSYAVKFASSFYGPFRDAAKSAPAFGDRKKYQLPLGSRGMAARAAARDVSEGADMIMVKPGMAYLDLVRETKNAHPDIPMFIYQVSGEFAMLYHGAANGAFKLDDILKEVFTGMKRAGADVIISYYTPKALELIKSGLM